MAQSVERILGKDEVISSILISSSTFGSRANHLKIAAMRRFFSAGVLELADEVDSKSIDGNIVRVRPPPPAPIKKTASHRGKRFFILGVDKSLIVCNTFFNIYNGLNRMGQLEP